MFIQRLMRTSYCAYVMITLFTIAVSAAVGHAATTDYQPSTAATIESGLDYLFDWSDAEKKADTIDLARLEPLVTFIRQSPELADHTPRDRNNIKGAFIALTIKRTLPDVIRYVYNRHIPEGVINPSSVNYSVWSQVKNDANRFPELWRHLDAGPTPFAAGGVVKEVITPDLHTGTYYEYDLKRDFILYRKGTLRIVFSLSSQIGDSRVGRKGYIVGDDQDWNYIYTQDTGLNKAGLGWVKSKIYNYYSVCCYIQDQAAPETVKIGVFQWLGAGWIGMNVVDSHHIRKGLLRFANQFKSMLESDQVPDPETLERVHQSLDRSDESVLREKAAIVTRFILNKAKQDDALRQRKVIQTMDEARYVARMSKPHLVATLMREYIKYCLGKETPLSPTFWAALREHRSNPGQPLS